MKTRFLSFFVLLFVSFSIPLFASAETTVAEKGSPFTDVTYQGPYVGVVHEATNYFLISIDGVKIEEIMAACEPLHGALCQELFAEEFVQLLLELNLPGTDWAQEGALKEVDLELYFMQTHKVTLFEDVTVSAENRNQVIINRLLRGE